MSEVSNEMSDRRDFDDEFGDTWEDESFKKLFEEQRNMEHALRQYVKKLIESVKRGDLKGRSEIIPIDLPGVTGFIFRQEFGATTAPNEESKSPAIMEERGEEKQGFAIPQSTVQEEREPVLETFADGDEFVALVELPGLEEDEIRVETGNSWIKIGAINFRTTQIDVPSEFDTSKTIRMYKNGVLEVRVPLATLAERHEEIRFGAA